MAELSHLSASRRSGVREESVPVLPVIEIGHLFPNYEPQVQQQNLDVARRESHKRSIEGQSGGESKKCNAGDGKKKKRRTTSLSPQAKATREEENTKRWDEMFERLKDYKDVHGNCNVPRLYKEDMKLANWVILQRVYRKKRRLALSNDRISKLEALGFAWRVRRGPRMPTGSVPPSWEQRLEALKEFRNEHGHCLVTCSHDKRLYRWVKTQRRGYRSFLKAKAGEKVHKSEGMTEERIAMLEEVGFIWDASYRRSGN